jgi:hypothetical protein
MAERKNLISKKKATYPVSDYLSTYLNRYGRRTSQGIRYEDLHRYDNSVPLYDEHGGDTLWSTVFYPQTEQAEIHRQLTVTYALLKAYGDISIAEHLFVDRVDLCLYGNTLPFRVRIVNRINDNFDYFYVKQVDANRIYGLELEHILSPNRIHYLVCGQTIIEEHIIGIPAEAFAKESMPEHRFDRVRLAKEFVKFNERCFVRLLGDMHSGNFVIDLTRDFEKWHFRMRPIDFDQQSHHWRKNVYLPQFYPQNIQYIQVGIECLAPENVEQYQKEERALIANRVRVSHGRYQSLIEVMEEDLISPSAHVERLASQLSEHYEEPSFETCLTMGELVSKSIKLLLAHNKPASPAFQAFPAQMPTDIP